MIGCTKDFDDLCRIKRQKGDAPRINEQSTFLDYLEKEWKLSGPVYLDQKPILYTLACIDHIVYIVSHERPIVKKIIPDMIERK